VVVGLHLDPLGAQRALGLAPLPPAPAADLPDAVRAELRLECGGRAGELVLRDLDLLDPDPAGVRDPLRGEGLQLLDGVVRGESEEGLDQVKTLIVGEMRSRSLSEGSAIQILRFDISTMGPPDRSEFRSCLKSQDSAKQLT
jgi:hypothetical protein